MDPGQRLPYVTALHLKKRLLLGWRQLTDGISVLSVASPYPTRPFDPGAESLDQRMLVLSGDDKVASVTSGTWTKCFITIHGERHYLWRAVDQDGDVLDILVTSHRDKRAAKRFFRKVLKHHGSPPRQLVTDSFEAIRRPTEKSSQPSPIEPASTRTTELKFPSNTPESRNAKCFDSNQRHKPNAFPVSIHNLFRVGRHHLKATHHRLLRERAFTDWKRVTCVC